MLIMVQWILVEGSSCCNEHLGRHGERDAFLPHTGNHAGRLHFELLVLLLILLIVFSTETLLLTTYFLHSLFLMTPESWQ